MAGYVKLRDKHWFEKPDGDADDADLYAPASMLFAGSLARTDRTTGGGIAQGPVGMIFGKIRGVEKSRIEPRISQMEHLSMERQIVTIIRNEDNDLCFVGQPLAGGGPQGRAQVLHVVSGAALSGAAHRRCISAGSPSSA